MMDTNGRAFQGIAATITICGEQDVAIDSHGTGGTGSYITVTTPNLMISVHTRGAARTYAQAWAEARELALRLPETRNVQIPAMAARMPGVVVRAYGRDRFACTFNPSAGELWVRVGQLTWLVLDQSAFRSVDAAWSRVEALNPIVLPKRDAMNES